MPLRTIGLVGGVTWHSTAVYYDRINRGVAAALGPYRSASLVLASIDYGTLREARRTGQWRSFTRHLVGAARSVQRAGAEAVFVCSNTLHALADPIQAQVSIPLVHVADTIADRARAEGMDTVGLLGTAYTVTQPFYRERLARRGLGVVVPDAETVAELDTILLERMARGEVLDADRVRFVAAIDALRKAGAQAVVLGCTEIGLLVGPGDVDVVLLDSTEVHADAAVAWSIG